MSRNPALDPHSALVLSGGGTKGAFEVGALQYLTRNADYAPGIVAGTSAGALIAGPLAQARDGAGFRRLAAVIRRNALSVTDIRSVFGEEDWLKEIAGTPLGDLVHEFISVRSRPVIPAEERLGSDPLRIPEPPRRHRTLYAMATALANSTKIVRASRQLFSNGNSIMNLDPLEAGYRGHGDNDVQPLDERMVAGSGVALRLTIASMRTGRPRYVTESGRVTENDGVSIRSAAGHPGVIEGMMASSSVPIMFPPRRIGDDIYCDGGVLSNTPLDVALKLGARRAIAVLATPTRLAEDDTDYTKASMAAVYARAASVMGPNALQQANLQRRMPDGSAPVIIAPTVEVLGGFEVEGGLIELDFDYGWLRAAEATSDLSQHDRVHLGQLSDQIATHRERAWFLEQRLLRTGHRLNLAGALRHARAVTLMAASEWRASGLEPPAGMETWGLSWENHGDPVPDELISVGQVG